MSDFYADMAAAAERAVSVSRARGEAVLDYSVASLVVVEEMLAEMSAADLTTHQINTLAQDFGSYILETARRLHGGEYEWLVDRQEPVLVWGAPEYHVALTGWGKARGRLVGDRADNIPFFYAGFSERIKNPPPDRRVTFV